MEPLSQRRVLCLRHSVRYRGAALEEKIVSFAAPHGAALGQCRLSTFPKGGRKPEAKRLSSRFRPFARTMMRHLTFRNATELARDAIASLPAEGGVLYFAKDTYHFYEDGFGQWISHAIAL